MVFGTLLVFVTVGVATMEAGSVEDRDGVFTSAAARDDVTEQQRAVTMETEDASLDEVSRVQRSTYYKQKIDYRCSNKCYKEYVRSNDSSRINTLMKCVLKC